MTRSRALVALVAVLATFGSACSDDTSTPGPSKDDPRRVTVEGVSFEVPEGWKELDRDTVDQNAEAVAEKEGLAESLGLTVDQFVELMAQVDLYLYDGGGETNSFTDNLNVTTPESTFPEDHALEQQLTTLGADVGAIEHHQTPFGDTVELSYEISVPSASVPIQGRSIWIDIGSAPLSITISTTDDAKADELSDLIIGSLQKDE